MSFYHFNLCWQTVSDKWRCGFFERLSRRPFNDDEDYDPEWDDEFGENFEWVSREFDTAEQAMSSAPYPNPGGSNIIKREGNEKYCGELDELAAKTRRVG
jgi:hypothetical protein